MEVGVKSIEGVKVVEKVVHCVCSKTFNNMITEDIIVMMDFFRLLYFHHSSAEVAHTCMLSKYILFKVYKATHG